LTVRGRWGPFLDDTERNALLDAMDCENCVGYLA
jgi:hypothetical protein